MEFFAAKFQIFTVLFARILAFTSVSPVFSGEVVSFFYRVALAFIISLIVTPVTPMSKEFYTMVQSNYFILILEQIFMGFLIGISLQILFGAFQMAGEFFSVQMGFGISEVYDPLSQVSLPLIGTFNNLFALLIFFVSHAHILVIEAVVFSFEKIPYFPHECLMNGKIQKGILEFLIFLSSSMFIIAMKIALPVMGCIFLVSLTLGILGKAAPQMNIMMLGFPLKIFVAFIVLAWFAPVFIELMRNQFDTFFQHLDYIIKNWS